MFYKEKKKRVLKPKPPKRKPNLWERIKIYKLQAKGKTPEYIARVLKLDLQCLQWFLEEFSLHWIQFGMQKWELIAIGKKLRGNPEALEAYFDELLLLKGSVRGSKIYYKALDNF